MNAEYVRTVQLLLAVAPAIFDTTAFAMKGGTALNLFLQDMPRLSVDIDVVFVPMICRATKRCVPSVTNWLGPKPGSRRWGLQPPFASPRRATRPSCS